jgi:hypothetical protein
VRAGVNFERALPVRFAQFDPLPRRADAEPVGQLKRGFRHERGREPELARGRAKRVLGWVEQLGQRHQPPTDDRGPWQNTPPAANDIVLQKNHEGAQCFDPPG